VDLLVFYIVRQSPQNGTTPSRFVGFVFSVSFSMTILDNYCIWQANLAAEIGDNKEFTTMSEITDTSVRFY
jgi:hypothetical protein